MNVVRIDEQTAAIGAHELRDGHVLIGDALCPTRFDPGLVVRTVNDDLSELVFVIAGSRELEFLPDQTVYVARESVYAEHNP